MVIILVMVMSVKVVEMYIIGEDDVCDNEDNVDCDC